jgi:ATP-dependent Clp protease ATP-binding subunit ClpC
MPILSAVAIIAGLVLMFVAWKVKNQNGGKMIKLGSGNHLSAFTTDLTELARKDKLESVAEREAEMERVIQILMRRTKNNPVLLGEPGVGKTAVVYGIAERIAKGNVPSALKGKKVLALDVNMIVSDTKFRGELEGRMKRLLSELEKVSNSVILFIDEIHLIAQMSGTEGSLGVSDVLKPALARGDIRIIGATTFAEYQKYIRSDQAFERRLQPVIVSEPSQKAALEMLKHLRPSYEKFHNVKITDKALKEAVYLSAEKINHRYLPDKAIDVMDEAAAKAAIEAEREHLVSLGVVHAASKLAVEVVDVDDVRAVIKEWSSINKKI